MSLSRADCVVATSSQRLRRHSCVDGASPSVGVASLVGRPCLLPGPTVLSPRVRSASGATHAWMAHLAHLPRSALLPKAGPPLSVVVGGEPRIGPHG